jgi:hypothetical protein
MQDTTWFLRHDPRLEFLVPKCPNQFSNDMYARSKRGHRLVHNIASGTIKIEWVITNNGDQRHIYLWSNKIFETSGPMTRTSTPRQ